MSLKWIKITSVFLTFLLCFLTHFMYDFFPNTLFSIFFPVNESIWEHMKMLFSSIIIYSAFDYILLKIFKQNTNNYMVNLFTTACLSIPIFLIIYLPIYHFTGENMILNITVLFITLAITETISYYILKSNKFSNLNYISLTGIILMYIIFGILTYYPPLNNLFYDPSNDKYGINIYPV